MTSSRRPERHHHRAYTDDCETLRERNDPRAAHSRYPPPRYEDKFDQRPSHPSRRKTYQEPREHQNPRYHSPSPPGRESRRPAYDSDSDYFSPRHSNRRDDRPAYYDEYDSRGRNRQRERPRDERPLPRQGFRSDYDVRPTRRDRPGRPARKESQWQKQAKDIFTEYAVPVIKKEGARFLSKQLEGMIKGKR